MPFRWFSKEKKAGPADDPVRVYDELIASVARQGEAVRQSAATLGVLRSQLKRDGERYRQRIAESAERLKAAEALGDATALNRLHRDATEAKRLATECDEGFARADTDARQLLEVAESLASQLTDLKAERLSAKTRMATNVMTQTSLRARADEFDRWLKLDKARDDIERAHALAELYREDDRGKKPR